MKKMITLFIAISFVHAAGAQLIETTPSSSSAQVLGQVKYAGPAKATLTYTVKGSDSTYLLMLYDERPQEKKYFSISFAAKDNTLMNLYELMLSYVSPNTKQEPRSFMLGNTTIVLQSGSSLAFKTVYLGAKRNRIELRRNELDKLFGLR